MVKDEPSCLSECRKAPYLCVGGEAPYLCVGDEAPHLCVGGEAPYLCVGGEAPYLCVGGEQALLATAVLVHLELRVGAQLTVRHHARLHPVRRLPGRVRLLRRLRSAGDNAHAGHVSALRPRMREPGVRFALIAVYCKTTLT